MSAAVSEWHHTASYRVLHAAAGKNTMTHYLFIPDIANNVRISSVISSVQR